MDAPQKESYQSNAPDNTYDFGREAVCKAVPIETVARKYTPVEAFGSGATPAKALRAPQSDRGTRLSSRLAGRYFAPGGGECLADSPGPVPYSIFWISKVFGYKVCDRERRSGSR